MTNEAEIQAELANMSRGCKASSARDLDMHNESEQPPKSFLNLASVKPTPSSNIAREIDTHIRKGGCIPCSRLLNWQNMASHWEDVQTFSKMLDDPCFTVTEAQIAACTAALLSIHRAARDEATFVYICKELRSLSTLQEAWFAAISLRYLEHNRVAEIAILTPRADEESDVYPNQDASIFVHSYSRRGGESCNGIGASKDLSHLGLNGSSYYSRLWQDCDKVTITRFSEGPSSTRRDPSAADQGPPPPSPYSSAFENRLVAFWNV